MAACVICLFEASPAWAGRRLALVVGNDAYGGTNRLSSCVNDANAIAQWLYSAGYERSEVTVATDVNRVELVAALERLARDSADYVPEQVLIYYSGHGVTLEDDNGDEGPNDPNDEAFVTIDDLESIASVEEVILRDDSFYRFVDRIRQRTSQLVILLDCCYSGGGLKSLGGSARLPEKAITEADLYAALAKSGVSTKGLRDGPAAGTKDLRSENRIPEELQKSVADAGDLLFLSASNEFQRARAGDPADPKSLSAFTDALLDILGRQPELSIDQLHQRLTQRLKHVPQSPVVVCRGLSTRDMFQPEIFLSPEASLRQSASTAVLEQLLTLPTASFSSSWKPHLEPTRAGSVPVGERFAFTVTPNREGYLVLFTVESSGEVTFLYPNPYRTDNFVRANVTRTIPYRDALLVERPVGTETYFAYMSTSNPFHAFPFSKNGSLVAGQLENIVRRRPDLAQQFDVNTLHQALTRGMQVEALSSRHSDEDKELWTRQIVTIQTVEP